MGQVHPLGDMALPGALSQQAAGVGLLPLQLEAHPLPLGGDLLLPAAGGPDPDDQRPPDIQPALVDRPAVDIVHPGGKGEDRGGVVGLHLHDAGEGDLVLPVGDAVPGGDVVDGDHRHPLQFQLAGAGPPPGDGGGHRALEDTHDIRAVIGQKGVALDGLLHLLVDKGLVYKKWLPREFQFHVLTSPPL